MTVRQGNRANVIVPAESLFLRDMWAGVAKTSQKLLGNSHLAPQSRENRKSNGP